MLRGPALKPGLHRAWRARHTIQLGLDPRQALVLDGLDAGLRSVLDVLDGSHAEAELLARAGAHGTSPTAVLELLRLLGRAGLLLQPAASPPATDTPQAGGGPGVVGPSAVGIEGTAPDSSLWASAGSVAGSSAGPVPGAPSRSSADPLPGHPQLEPAAPELPGLAPDLAARSLLGADPDDVLASRRAARVEVLGAGRAGSAIATLLVAAAVGSVVLVDDEAARAVDAFPGALLPEDEGFPRGPALAARLSAGSPGAAVESAPALTPVAPASPDRPAAHAQQRLVVLGPDRAIDPAVVASLVRDGVAHLHVELRETLAVVGPLVVPGKSSCQRCHDLHRRDRDPQWPLVRAQLHDFTGRAGCDVVLAAGVAAVVAAQVLGHLEGRPVPAIDGTLEVALPDLTVRRRSWHPHPACGCMWELTG